MSTEDNAPDELEPNHTLQQLMRGLNAAYGDGWEVASYFNLDDPDCPRIKKKEIGPDTLALFLGIELIETYDHEASADQQEAHVSHLIDNAIEDLQSTQARFLK